MSVEIEAGQGAGPSFRLGEWLVEPELSRISNGSTTTHLRAKVMGLLMTLAGRPGQVFSKQELLDAVWPAVVVADGSLSVTVAELREALGDDSTDPRYIETIPRRGYRMIAPVAPLDVDRVQPAGSRLWLIGAGVDLVLHQGENLIGRAPDAHVWIKSPKISRRHARITVDGDRAVVEDLGSKNGTFVGDVRVDGPTPLGHADQIRLGQLAALLRVVVADHESTITELSKELAKESFGNE
jgi:DNA-binding winged helix-turn-helix (wHTH) protein